MATAAGSTAASTRSGERRSFVFLAASLTGILGDMSPTLARWDHHRTGRLILDHVTAADVDDWHAIHADPDVWSHFPSGRHTTREQTEQFVNERITEWSDTNLSYWSVRSQSGGKVIGSGGCRPIGDRERWNLYYRFDPAVQGRGYASELARASIDAANAVESTWPVLAIMLQANPASWRVAEKVGMTRIWEGPDEDNPDPSAIRLVYADRPDITP